MWLPTGVGIAFLYFGGVRFWPGVLVGDLLANDYMRIPVGSAVGQTLGNLLEIVVAVVLIKRLVPVGSPLGSSRGVGRMLFAMAVGTLASAVVGTLSLRFGHVVTTSSIPDVARTWWLGDFCGALIVTPLALAWWQAEHAVVAEAQCLRGVAAARRRDSAELSRAAHPQSRDLPRVPGPHLGRTSFRSARRDAQRSSSRRRSASGARPTIRGRSRSNRSHGASSTHSSSSRLLPCRRSGSLRSCRSARTTPSGSGRHAASWSRHPTPSGVGSSGTSTMERSSV